MSLFNNDWDFSGTIKSAMGIGIGVLESTCKTLDYLFVPFLVDTAIEEAQAQHVRREQLACKTWLNGKRERKEEGMRFNRNRVKVYMRYWAPPQGVAVKALAFISHGFTEHIGNYESVGELLSQEGIFCFGHDHIGHGQSGGQRCYIDNVNDYVQDVADTVDSFKRRVSKFGLSDLPMFCIAHSMGGMIAIRAALDHPDLFNGGLVFVGPLIFPGPSTWRDFHYESVHHLVNLLGTTAVEWLDWLVGKEAMKSGYTRIGRTNVDLITRDQHIRALLANDNLRYFKGAYLKLLVAFSQCIEDNLKDLNNFKNPFMILFGKEDQLCNVRGAFTMLHKTDLVQEQDKELIEYDSAAHQLYMEVPVIRERAVADTLRFISKYSDHESVATLPLSYYETIETDN